MALADSLVQTYCLTQVHVPSTPAAAPLRIARASGMQSDKPDALRSQILIRANQPSLFYTIEGPVLTLVAMGTRWPATVFHCGDRIIDAGCHDDNDNVIVHVFTAEQVLYTMILTAEEIEDPTVKRKPGWITEFAAPTLSTRPPFFMKSVNATTVFFALEDGGVLRLANNGQAYNEHLIDSAWRVPTINLSYLKSMIRKGRAANLVIAMQASARHVLCTLSVDSKLRVWNLQTGLLVVEHDVSGAAAAATNYLLDPVAVNLLALYDHPSGYMVVTYCPHQPGLFKVFHGNATACQEVMTFKEELPADGLWRVSDVCVSQVTDQQFLLHVLWKSDTLTRVQIGVVSLATRTVSWQVAARHESMRFSLASTVSLEHWIFEPSRFSLRTLKKALVTVMRQDVDLEHVRDHQTALQATHRLLADTIPLQIDEETGTELVELQEENIRLQYHGFAQVCVELDRLGAEPHALCASPTGEVLVAQSDRVVLVRPGNTFERLARQCELHPGVTTEKVCLELLRLMDEHQTAETVEALKTAFQRQVLSERTISAQDYMSSCYEDAVASNLPEIITAAIAKIAFPLPTVLDTLRGIATTLYLKLRGVSPQGATGVAGFVACQRNMAMHAQRTLVHVTTLAAYFAYHASDADVQFGSNVFLKSLDTFKRVTLVVEACAASLKAKDSPTDQTAFGGLAEAHAGKLDHQIFLDQLLVFLIARGEAFWAEQFCLFEPTSAFNAYLGARGQLVLGKTEEAAKTFARIALPLMNTAASPAENDLPDRPHRGSLSDLHLHVARLFTAQGCHAQALRFCREAEVTLSMSTTTNPQQERAVATATFETALQALDFDAAYLCLSKLVKPGKIETLRRFLSKVCEADQASKLSAWPFIGMLDEVDDELQAKAFAMREMHAKPAYHWILYSWRIGHCNFRGAACALYRRLQVLKACRGHFSALVHLELTEGYLAILNALRCMAPDDQWIIVGDFETLQRGDAPSAPKRPKEVKDVAETTEKPRRRLLSLEDVREEYLAELHNLKVQLEQLKAADKTKNVIVHDV